MDFPFVKEAISQLFSKPSCAMYPAVESIAAPRYRGRIAFYPDKCINCMMCERVCCGGAITHTVEKTEESDRITRSFDLGCCTFCAHCMDFCNHGAIELTQDYHMVATKDEDLIVSGTFIKKPPVKKTAPPKAPAAPAAPKETKSEPSASGSDLERQKGEADVKSSPKAETERSAPVLPRDDGKPVQDPNTCVYCTICARKCPAGALTVDRAAKTWVLDEDACVGCGTCAAACPKKAIIM